MLRLHPRQLPSRRRVSLLAQPPARRRDSAEAEDRGRVLRLHQGHMQQRVRLTPLSQTPARSPEGSRATRHARETPDQKARTLFDDRRLFFFSGPTRDATPSLVPPSSAHHHATDTTGTRAVSRTTRRRSRRSRNARRAEGARLRPRRCRSRFRSRRRKKRRRRLRARSALPGGRASPLTRSLQTRNTRNTSDLPRTRTRRVVTTQGRSRRRTRPRLRRARTGTKTRGPPSPAAARPRSRRSRRRDATAATREALARVRAFDGARNAPFGNEIEKSSVRRSFESLLTKTPNVRNFSFGSGRRRTAGVKRGAGPSPGPSPHPSDAGDVPGGAVEPETAPRGFGKRRRRVGPRACGASGVIFAAGGGLGGLSERRSLFGNAFGAPPAPRRGARVGRRRVGAASAGSARSDGGRRKDQGRGGRDARAFSRKQCHRMRVSSRLSRFYSSVGSRRDSSCAVESRPGGEKSAAKSTAGRWHPACRHNSAARGAACIVGLALRATWTRGERACVAGAASGRVCVVDLVPSGSVNPAAYRVVATVADVPDDRRDARASTLVDARDDSARAVFVPPRARGDGD